jgi:hypothetical protein
MDGIVGTFMPLKLPIIRLSPEGGGFLALGLVRGTRGFVHRAGLDIL